MTITYTADIANGGTFVCFWKVLIRWRGSLYRLIWQDLLVYCAFFLAVDLVHTYALPAGAKLVLQKVKGYLASNLTMFPIPFVLSFFVDQVATKWWHQYQMVPSPDTLAIYTNAAIPGRDEQSRIMRRTIVRYAILSLVLTLRDISTRIKKRFPTLKNVQDAGLILEDEIIQYDKLESQMTANNWMPLVWAANVATHANSVKKVSSEQCLKLLIGELTAHRDKLGILVNYDLVNIPLVYTQTVFVMVISYVLLTLVSHQPAIDVSAYPGLGGFTVTSITNFVIYVGLMKVATVMLNPFGEDDDDFEVNATVDRHIKAAYMIVDEMHEEQPEVVKDAYWDEIVPKALPYTVGSKDYRKQDPHSEDNAVKGPKKKFSFIRKSSTVSPSDFSIVDQEPKKVKENATKSNRHYRVNRVDSKMYDIVESCLDTSQPQPSTSKQTFVENRWT